MTQNCDRDHGRGPRRRLIELHAIGYGRVRVSSVPETAYYVTALPRGVVFVAGGGNEPFRLWAASGGKPAAPVTDDLLDSDR